MMEQVEPLGKISSELIAFLLLATSLLTSCDQSEHSTAKEEQMQRAEDRASEIINRHPAAKPASFFSEKHERFTIQVQRTLRQFPDTVYYTKAGTWGVKDIYERNGVVILELQSMFFEILRLRCDEEMLPRILQSCLSSDFLVFFKVTSVDRPALSLSIEGYVAGEDEGSGEVVLDSFDSRMVIGELVEIYPLTTAALPSRFNF